MNFMNVENTTQTIFIFEIDENCCNNLIHSEHNMYDLDEVKIKIVTDVLLSFESLVFIKR